VAALAGLGNRRGWPAPHGLAPPGRERVCIIEPQSRSGPTSPTALRHYYASLLIRHGESVKTVQARLGHASAVETLDTYSHLWPDSEDRTRDAIDSVLGFTADPLRTEAVSPS
jgi:hypothetical protein